MLPAFLTTIFYALSALFATRSGRLLGAAKANLGRMTVALVLLGIWAHTMGQGLHGASFGWFLVSGIIGYGFGDLALFQALPRIGPRLTMLLIHCFAVPLAAVLEWVWLGTMLEPREIACICVILGGVYVALTPVRHFNLKSEVLWVGVFFAMCASLGQAGSTVISRKANLVAKLSGMHIDGGTAAYQRMIGGIVLTAIVTLLVKGYRTRKRTGGGDQPHVRDARQQRRGWLFVLLNAVAGPALGVTFFQWAISIAPSGIVLPIVATTPVVTIPLAYWIDGDRPTRRSIVGGVIAVGGAAMLAWMVNL
jgi:drug/metabolite transporter (DMT)-like permease